MQTLRPDLKLFIHPVKCCTPLTAPGRDDRLRLKGGIEIGLKGWMQVLPGREAEVSQQTAILETTPDHGTHQLISLSERYVLSH